MAMMGARSKNRIRGMTAIILAGGKSSRMGSDKALVRIKGIPLIKRQITRLKRIFAKVTIVADRPEKYRFRNVRVVPDIIPGRGPLAGIYSGLVASDSFYNFVVACDLPFISLPLIRHMAYLKNGFSAVVPRWERGYEALFAIYAKDCLGAIRETLRKGDLRIISFFDKIKLREIPEEKLVRFGDPEILFMNINTEKDLWKISTSRKK